MRWFGKFFDNVPVTIPTTYKKRMWCYNCSEGNNLEIPLGTTIKEYLKTYKCKNCGCLWEQK